ncbi:hypothetical protein AOC05_02490 [Arthrobacter alpinus]|uniref:N-acetyltransferase domain-containing protein n=1 Tax=Arthrobacter alpinus TaxID=656366 RepID=A0A0M5LWZ9_9MICC|nr:hypothetical protein AOC05_02490 [Arthrobacter alpinus]
MPALYETFNGSASPTLWSKVSALFVEIFAAEPYCEDPAELLQIVDWGPAQLAQSAGRLLTCSHEEQLLGFALVHSLHGDDSWQNILATIAQSVGKSSQLPTDPQEVLVVHELAVDPAARGQRIAKSALATIFSGRAETHVVLGVYGQATTAREVYQRWVFTELGIFTTQNNTVDLHVIHCQLPCPAKQ